jgi:hypothetical protein
MAIGAIGRRRIGIGAWLSLSVVTAYWLIAGLSAPHWLIWLVVMLPFPLLMPGLAKPARNAFLLALLATVGYAMLGVMDAIANPDALVEASVLALASLAAFFLLIPAVRTLPAPPRRDEP